MNLRLTPFRFLAAIACTGLLLIASTPIQAQMGGMSMPSAQPDAPLPSPPATANVAVAGGTIRINYNTPHLRGRHVGTADIVPYGEVWRTGANPATTIITSAPLKFGTLLVPAGTHTLYSLPTADSWQLILNNQTGQWGTEYKQDMDLGRIPMTSKPVASPQEIMSLSFENTTPTSTELHIRWDKVDEFVTITKP
jgi:Protein of unknown function (DUF2911)